MSQVAVAPQERVRSLVVAVPVWAWLAGLIALSAVVRFLLARRSPAPWIFVDELIYSELAKGFADSGQLTIREAVTTAYGFVYPVLLAPAYAVFDNVPHAYAAAKAINAVVMSLAAVPAYLLARRLLGQWLSLVVAVLAVALPSMVYTGTIMTENAFYPAFLGAVLGIVLVLERATAARQLAALGLIALAFFVRVQAVALLAVLVSAIALHALLEARAEGQRVSLRPLLRRLGAYRATWLGVGACVLLLVVVQVARGRSLGEILGAYRAAGDVDYSVGDVARWFLYHVAELDLYLGVLPFAAFLLVVVGALRCSGSSRAERIFAAVSVPAVFWLALLVAAFASQPSVSRVEERNLFYVAPLFFIALLAWVERGLPRPRAVALAAAAVAAALPGFLPYLDLINPSAVSDTLALLPWWDLQDSVITGPQVRPVVIGASIAVGLLFLLLPRRLALAAPALVLALFAVVSEPIASRIEQASVGGLFSGIRVEREWIDEALPEGATAAAIWSGNTNEHAIWLNEFFNRRLERIYHVAQPLPGNLPESPVRADERSGALLDGDGRTVIAEYALSDGSFPLRGEPVAQDPGMGMTLYRVGGPLFLTARIEGLHPNDTWSGPEVRYTRLDCTGGRLVVTLTSDPALFSVPQTVTASVGGREVARATVAPTAVDQPLAVPLEAEGGDCRVRFGVSPTAVPAEVAPGSADPRELGIHFTAFRFQPP